MREAGMIVRPPHERWDRSIVSALIAVVERDERDAIPSRTTKVASLAAPAASPLPVSDAEALAS
jgi:hypothetical protein